MFAHLPTGIPSQTNFEQHLFFVHVFLLCPFFGDLSRTILSTKTGQTSIQYNPFISDPIDVDPKLVGSVGRSISCKGALSFSRSSALEV
jgi:hypothetical protein